MFKLGLFENYKTGSFIKVLELFILVHSIGMKSFVVAQEVGRSVEVLKTAAKTRKVAAEEILSAFKILEKAKLNPSGFLDTLGGTESPGRTWMLIFTAEVLSLVAHFTISRV